MNDDAVFKALADANRRGMLDRLRRQNGQTLSELCRGLGMSRQAVAKHLDVLAGANLVTWRREGRERLHFLNPVPIHGIALRWIARFEQDRLDAIGDLKQSLEAAGEENT